MILPDAMIGQTISRYRIVAKLGGGGMGVVYRAEDTRLGRPVAIKFLPEKMADDSTALARFEREARAASRLNHPHICTVHDVGSHQGQPFLVMELMQGETLKHVIEKGRSSGDQVIAIGVQVADALQAAHSAGIVHRDIKPANLFLTQHGEVKVLDFGLAKMAQAKAAQEVDGPTEVVTQQQLTTRGQTLGTILYMSPEQARGEDLDARTDLFSLGVVLYELATGWPPFAAETPALVFDQILNKPPKDPKQLNRSLVEGVDAILSKALEKDKTLRYQSAADLKADLERLQRNEESAALSGRASVWEGTPAFPRPRRGLALTLGAAAVALAVAAGIWLSRGPSEAPEQPRASAPAAVAPAGASIAVLPFADLSPEGDQEYFADGLAEELLNALAQIRELKVAGRASSFQFKGRDEDLRTIGEKLNVATILGGSVQTVGDQVRIRAFLSNADGFQLWSQTYTRTLDDIFAVQDDIATTVAEKLEVTLLGGGTVRPTRTDSTEAYNLYLQGHYFYERGAEEDLVRAADYLERALEREPDFARAWAELGAVRSRQADDGYLPAKDGYARAGEAVERALELDPDLADAWAALGWIKNSFEWDWKGADAAYERALELEPGNARVVRRAASMAATRGRFEEAVRLGQRAAELDPLSSDVHLNRAHHALRAGRLEEAVAAAHKALELRPGRSWAHSLAGRAYLAQSRVDDALRELEQEAHPALRLQGLALAYHADGRHQEAQAALGDLIDEYANDAAFQIAEVYAYWGDVDAAFAWLERARKQRDGGLADMLGDFLLASLEGDQRWRPFLAEMGLEPTGAERS